MSKGPSELLIGVFKDLFIRPDRMQFSLATFAVASLHRHPKQLWKFFSGQGKSRIVATAALYALNETIIENVHIVFPTAHLMVRDK